MLNKRKIIRRTRKAMCAARDRALFFWSYLVLHPEVTNKQAVPREVFHFVKNDQSNCPICSIFLRETATGSTCSGCPLIQNGKLCYSDGGLFQRWWELRNAELDTSSFESIGIRATRRDRARAVLEAIREWNTLETPEEADEDIQNL